MLGEPSCSSSSRTVRFLHNVSQLPNSVNIRWQTQLLVTNLTYGEFTAELQVPADHCKEIINLELINWATGAVLLQKQLILKPQFPYLIVLAGQGAQPETVDAFAYRESRRCPAPGQSELRFINGVYGSLPVDLYANQTKIFEQVAYSETGQPVYLSWPTLTVNLVNNCAQLSNNLELVIKLAGTDQTVGQPVTLKLINQGVYTLVSSQNNQSIITLLISQDNASPDFPCQELMRNFDLQAYMGKWYQIASIPQFYETNCARAQAEYTWLADRVKVFNTCLNQQNQVVSTIEGSARPVNFSQPAALLVTFPGFDNPATNLPTNLPTNQPTNSPNNPPNNSPANLPTNLPTNQPANLPTNLPNNPPTNLPTNSPTNLPTNLPNNPPTNSPTNLPNPSSSCFTWPNFTGALPNVNYLANYLVHDTDYTSYAVIGSPTLTTLYILSRKSKMKQSTYQKLVDYAGRLGYQTDLLRVNYHAVITGPKNDSTQQSFKP